jgi:hypothetical protein
MFDSSFNSVRYLGGKRSFDNDISWSDGIRSVHFAALKLPNI